MISKSQRVLLNFVISFTKKNGYTPSYREIRDGLGYKSISSISNHVDNLIKEGYLRKRKNAARSLEPLEPLERTLLDRVEEIVQTANTDDVRAVKRALELLGYPDIAKEL